MNEIQILANRKTNRHLMDLTNENNNNKNRCTNRNFKGIFQVGSYVEGNECILQFLFVAPRKKAII